MTSTDVLAVVDVTARIERRASWRQSVTNHAPDPSTNLVKPEGRLPPMHKSYQHDSAAAESARLEVQSLSDVLPAIAPGASKIADRIQESRRPRHDQALEDMKHELAHITAELEPRIRQASDHLKQQLAEEGRVVEELMNKAGTKKCLQAFTLDQLEGLWSSVAQRTPIRQKCLCAFEETLNKIESDRSSMVTDVISHYGSVLQAIAYLLPEEVTKLMEDTAHTINLALIANKKSYAALMRHLMIVELMKEKDLREQWEVIVGEWKEVICSDVTNRFRSYMESDVMQNPPQMQKIKALLKAEQTAVTRQREELLNQFSSMRPPNATKLAVYEWNEKVLRLQHQLEHIHNTYLVQLQQCSEAAIQQCQQEMEKCKCCLIDSKACTDSSIYEVLNKHFVPLVEACSTSLREQLQAAERSLDVVLCSQQAQFQALFQYAQGAASLWDSHMAALDDTQRQHQDALVKRRTSHDLENQNLEANLDIVLDRLRQCPAKEEAHRLLSMIKEGYTTFYTNMLTEVPRLLPSTKEALASYESSLCKYLGVGRHPSKGKKAKPQGTKTSYVSASPGNKRGGARGRAGTQSRAASVASAPPSPLASIVEEVISTTHGTSFYVQSLLEDVQLGPATFLTQDEEAEGITDTFATEGLSISEEAFIHARNQMRASFLDQLEAWKVELTSKTEEIVAGKLEEIHTELDIRTHLHNPRLGRVDDIGHTREAELLAHKDRVLRHSSGVLSALDESKSLVESLSEKQNRLMEQCSAQLQTIEKSFYTADRLNSLKAVEAQLNDVAHKHVEMVKALGETHLKTAQDILSDLLASNDSFRISLKSFSEGGNYCHEEIEGFTRKLGKLSAKIEGVRGSVSKDLLALTEVGLAQSREAADLVKSHLQAHLVDISFLEAISSALANAQVKIKSEVATSNKQAQSLLLSVQQLQVLVDQCGTTPGLKKIEPSDLLAELPKVLASFLTRVDYLYCRAATYQEAKGTTLPKGAAERQPISAVNVTKSIMEAVTRKKADPEVEPPPSSRHAKYLGSQTILDAQPAAHTEAPGHKTEAPGHKTETGLHKSHKKQAVLERKNVNFGSGGGEDGTESFLPRIRAILVDVHTQLFQMAEVFYKQRGSRPATRADQLKESFELCLDHLIQRCQSYRMQAEEYRNDCTAELHEQLEQLMTILEQIPLVVFVRVREECQAKADEERKAAMEIRLQELERSSKDGASHVSSLCPALGHPCQRQVLEQLCVAEQERHTKALATIKDHAKSLKELVLNHANDFICKLHITTKDLTACFDSVTCPYEIVPGGKRPKPKQTVNQLIRESRQSVPAIAEVSADVTLNSGSVTTWPGLSKAELAALFSINEGDNRSATLEAFAITEPLTSRKCTPVHYCIIKARDGVFQDYVASLTEQVQCVSQDEKLELNKEEKRFDYWVQLVQRVKDLYKVPT